MLLLSTGPELLYSKQDAKIDLRDIGRQPILIFHHGEARIRLDYKYYIHHFNLTSIRFHVRSLKDQFENLSKNQFTDLIVEKFNEIDFALKSIDPVKRQKRWDRLGSAWKFLAGNPDANDLRIINSSINNLIINNNEQIKINRELNLQLKEAIFKTKKAISLFNVGSIEIYCTRILFHLNFLSERLNQIIETITLAKLGIVNEKVLSQQEIEILIADLDKENVTVHTAIEATSYASTAVMSNKLEIALIIKMPKLDPRIFNKVHIYPIVQDRKQIHLPNPFFLTHGKDIYQVNSIEPIIYDESETHVDNSTCVPHLLRGNPATCNFTINPISEQISYLDDQHLLINSVTNFTLSSNCGLTDRNLSGSFVIHFHDCHLIINNISYYQRSQKLPGNPIQLPLDGIEVKKHQEVLNISLEHLHKLHLDTRKELEIIRLSAKSISWPHWTLIGGISFSPLIIGSIILSCFRAKTIKVKFNNPRKTGNSTTTGNQQNTSPSTNVENPNSTTAKHHHNIFRNPSPASLIRMEPHL